MNNEQLKPCPCCGGAAVRVQTEDYFGNDIYWIQCTECTLRTIESYCDFGNEQEMIDDWNKRVGDK